MLYAYFSLIFERISVKLGWYIGRISSINSVNFQVCTPNVMVTGGQNNSSILYILLFFATISQDLFNPCPWMFRPRIRLMGHPKPQFRAKADLPVGFPYRFNSRKWHTHPYQAVRRKKNSDSDPDTTPSPSSTFSHLMTVFNMFYLSAVAFTLIFVISISRQCPFIKVCRQSRRTFLLLYCLFFLVYFSFRSFPLSAFCDFSAIFHRISLIFGQLVDNDL